MISKEKKIQLDRSIAYFMGWRIDNSFPDKGKVWRKGNCIELETTFKFSTDWNALMEVYEKVNELEKYYCRFYPGHCIVYERWTEDYLVWEAPHKEESISTQEAVYRCLGEFIEHYNQMQINENKA